VLGDFGEFACSASRCPGTPALLHAWPHKCLGGSRVGQKSAVDVEHSQESTKLTGDLGRVARPGDWSLALPEDGTPRRTTCNRGRLPRMLERCTSPG
jgi:hypothetical protein